MPNGMENDELTYQVIEDSLSEEVLHDILLVYKSIFEDYKLDFFKNRIHQKEDVLTILSYNKKQLVGFKIGYRYDDTTFYSWVGGVLLTQRRQGIAQQLISIQHEQAKMKGYAKLRTKSMNRFKPMMILNLKNGFDITKIYTNTKGQTKIVFEKTI
jgi:predicted GNAT superfamily acetyltransferase